MRDNFHKLLANVRAALDQQPAPLDTEPFAGLPVTAAARRAELTSQFAQELERVNGRFMGVLSPAAACEKVLVLARELGAHRIALGGGVALDLSTLAKSLAEAGLQLIRTGNTPDEQRMALRERLADCELGVVEADYAMASTGTLVIVATTERPSSLTLLPPVNVILVDPERILPDMAAVVEALGIDTIRAHRVAFITGPSRTADIEKMIVLGVHGPKQLYAAAVWPNLPELKER